MERIKKYEPLWGKWIVKRKLGEGGFGAVYEVECDKFDSKPCAVKIISSKNEDIYKRMPMGVTLSSNEFEKQKEKEVKRKEKELELMNRLQGEENIVTIYDGDVYEQEDGIDVIIRMELLENLVSYIQKKQISSDEEWRKLVIKIGIDICKALEICEQKRIVHRDIKPENIFVNKKGTFKLGDFGISRELSKSASRSLKSQAGTELYMSPEAFDVLSKVDIRTDIYSLGITMYQCLNDGMPPFWKDGDYDARENAIRTRLSGTAIPVPKKDNGQLWKIVQKASQFNRENRYQHASEMRRDLEKLKYEERNDSIRNDLEITIESDIGSTIEEKSYRDKSRNYQKNVKEKERESLKHQQIFNLEKKKTLEKGQKIESYNQKGSEKQEERGNRRKKVKQKSLYKAIFILVSIITIGIALWMGYHVFFRTGVVNIPILGYLIICPLIIGGIIVVGCIYFEDEIRNMQKKLKEPKVKKSITIIIVLIQFVFGIVDLLGYYAFLSSDLTNQGAIILWVGIIILFVAIGIGICTESWLYLKLISLLMGAIMIVVVYKSDIVLNVFKSIQNIGMSIDGALRMFLK